MASVDDLLRRLHRQGASLRASGDPAGQLDAHLRGWAPLAAAAGRVLGYLDSRPEGRELFVLLHSLDRARNIKLGTGDPGLESMALVVGAIGDIVHSSPRTVGLAGQLERSPLQASIQAALHAAARATVSLARTTGRLARVETVRQVAEATELAVLLPPLARVSTLERLTAPRSDGVEGAVQNWAGAAERTFSNYQLVTGAALADAAATLATLCHVTSDNLREAARRRVSEPPAAKAAAQLLDSASAAWRQAAAWPTSVQLGGNAHEHRHAAAAVRTALTGPLLSRLTLRERVSTLRAAMATAQGISALQSATITRLARQGGLWVAREREDLRPQGVQRRHIKLEWEAMAPGHPAGRLLMEQASIANQALTAAAAAVDRSVLPGAPLKGDAGEITMLDHRIVADWWETFEPTTARTRRPEDEAAARSHHPSIAPGSDADYCDAAEQLAG